MPQGAGETARPMAAIFDLDRTVTRRPTFTAFLFFAARRRPAKLLLAPALAVAGLGYKLGLITRKRLKEIMLSAVLAGRPRARVMELAEAFVAGRLRNGLRPGARRAIATHRAAGDRLVLVTASHDFYAELFGRELGFDRVVATRAAWDSEDRLTGRIDGDNCYGAAKLAMLRDALPDLKNGFTVTVYTDHHTDHQLLDWADTPVAVAPSRRLRALAAARGYEIQDWDA